MSYLDVVREQALNRAIEDFNKHINEDGIIYLDELSSSTKSYLRKQCEGVEGKSTPQAKVEFVYKYTGRLLYVHHYNLKERIIAECVARGYVVDDVLDSVKILDIQPQESMTEWENKRKKFVEWSKSVSDYIKRTGETREQFLSDGFGRTIKYIYKYNELVKDDENLISIIGNYADENGCIDKLKSSKQYSTITKYLRYNYNKNGFDYITSVQAIQKFVNDNCPQFHFSKPVHVPNCKLDVKTRDLYNEAKEMLFDFANGGEISGLRKNTELYNKVRHIRDILGYESIKECVETMTGLEYNPDNFGSHKEQPSLHQVQEHIDKLIKCYYVDSKKPEEIKYVNGMIDVSGMSTQYNNIFKRAYRASKRNNLENHEELTLAEYMAKYHNCYYKSSVSKKGVLKTTNVFCPAGSVAKKTNDEIHM